MDEYLENSKIESFWEWFEAQDEKIRRVLSGRSDQDKEALVQAMDDQILRLGLFTWELGHGTRKDFYLTISPNGSMERLEQTREIMDYAPHLPHWEFNHAKPPQEWDLRFKLFDEDYIQREVDASKWKFTLIEHDDTDQVTIILEAANVNHLDFETKQTAADLVVTSLLGEEQKICYVREIEMVNQQKASSTPIQNLRQRFEAFLH